MSIFRLIKNTLFVRRPQGDEAKQSREIVERISQRAEELQANLKVYQNAKEPLVAMVADLYNRQQVSRIYHGLNGIGH